jgi:DNA-binding response OmpR family regulator
MLTSSRRGEDREKAFSLGADDYLLKPMDLDGFLAVAKRVMELVPESK